MAQVRGWIDAIDRAELQRQRNQLTLMRAARANDKAFETIWQRLTDTP